MTVKKIFHFLFKKFPHFKRNIIFFFDIYIERELYRKNKNCSILIKFPLEITYFYFYRDFDKVSILFSNIQFKCQAQTKDIVLKKSCNNLNVIN